MLHQAFSIMKTVNSNCSYNPEMLNLGKKKILSRVSLKFDGRPWKTLEHLFCDTSSFMHHFVAIGQFKLELQSGNSIRVKICDFFVPYDLEIWGMFLKNNRAPFLCLFKLCAPFRSHWSIQTGDTVQKHSIRVKFGDFFLPHLTLKFGRWPWKTFAHFFCATSSFVHHFIAISQYKLELI